MQIHKIFRSKILDEQIRFAERKCWKWTSYLRYLVIEQQKLTGKKIIRGKKSC